MKTSELMRTRREALGMLQRDVAQALGVRPRAYSAWERGTRFVPEAYRAPLALLLGLRPLDLAPTGTRRCTTSMPQRRRTQRGEYPNGATFDEMLQLGRLAAAIAREVRAALTADQFEMLADDFPRDTPYELLLVFIVIAGGGRFLWTSPARLHCSWLVMDDFLPDYGGDQMQWALSWESEGERIVLFPQVRLKAPWVKWSGRVDFLVYHKVPGRRAQWLYVELDGGQHRFRRDKDADRAEGLLIPEIRYDNRQVLSEYWFQRFLGDIRKASADGAKRAVARRHKADELRRERVLEIDARRAA